MWIRKELPLIKNNELEWAEGISRVFTHQCILYTLKHWKKMKSIYDGLRVWIRVDIFVKGGSSLPMGEQCWIIEARGENVYKLCLRVYRWLGYIMGLTICVYFNIEGTGWDKLMRSKALLGISGQKVRPTFKVLRTLEVAQNPKPEKTSPSRRKRGFKFAHFSFAYNFLTLHPILSQLMPIDFFRQDLSSICSHSASFPYRFPMRQSLHVVSMETALGTWDFSVTVGDRRALL